jgi:hypothetical protein
MTRIKSRGRGRAGAADKQGQGTSEPGRADRPGLEAEAWVRGREGGGQILIEGLGLYLLGLSPNTRSRTDGRDLTARAGLGAVAPLGPAARVRRRRANRRRWGTRGSGTSLGAIREV